MADSSHDTVELEKKHYLWLVHSGLEQNKWDKM